MSVNPFKKFFSPPDYLKTPPFGIDLSDESLKFVKLAYAKHGLSVVKSGEVKIPPGIITDGKIINPLKLEEILTKLRKEHKINAARVSILESQIYLFRTKISRDGLTSVREAIEFSLEEHIPIPVAEAIFDYEIIKASDKSLDVLVAVIPASVIEEYLSVFSTSLIPVSAFELEAQAMVRSIVPRGDMETYMIIDFGEKRTVLSIVSNGLVVFTTTLDFGGKVLSSTISKNFKVSFEEAEEIKKKYGLQRNVGNKELFPVLLNTVSILRDEILKHVTYWHTHKDEEGKANPPIKKLLLCGGDSNLIGLTDYFAVSMRTRVEMANVWSNLLNPEEHIPEIPFKRAMSYASAIGLALGDLDND